MVTAIVAPLGMEALSLISLRPASRKESKPMTARDHAPGYVPNPLYTQEDWDEVSDNPELTDEDFAALRPAREVLPPALFEALTATRRAQSPQLPPADTMLRLDPRVIDHFKATGEGWQDRINAILLKAAGL